jgi:hypothetical protein
LTDWFGHSRHNVRLHHSAPRCTTAPINQRLERVALKRLVARSPLPSSRKRNAFLGFESLPHRQFRSAPLAPRHVLRGQRASGYASATLTESLPHRQLFFVFPKHFPPEHPDFRWLEDRQAAVYLPEVRG